MRPDLLQRAAELARRGEPYVLAVVTWRRPSSSAQPGDMAIVTADGGFEGWLGGACTRPTVEREAHAALADGKPRLLNLSPDPGSETRPGIEVRPMTCHSGGSVEIYLEPVLPAPRLAVFGDSPAARTLARLATTLGYAVEAVAPDSGPEDFGDGVTVHREAADLAPGSPERALFAVVATMGDWDEEALQAALGLAPAYVGTVASERRFGEMRATLTGRGVDPALLDAVHSPAGLDIGARTPEEIALAVLAQIVQARRAVEAMSAAAAQQETVSATALDPICGMTVDVETARHTAEHDGRTFYFCCGGCRERFLADPESHLAAGGRG
ncbi:MAG TPA: XdhC family protein [Thermoanaerobaculia bacterium]|nr:XdhC family protein [Thermoanaerobaculia bacterium]